MSIDRCNSSGINLIGLGFHKAETLPVEIGMKRVDDKGGETFVEQETEQIVAVMSGGLKPYFYFAQICRRSTNSLEQVIKTDQIVLVGEIYQSTVSLTVQHIRPWRGTLITTTL